MNIIHADIFFFITTCVVAVFGILGAIFLIYAIVVIKNLKELSKKIKEEGAEIVDGIHEFRTSVYDDGRFNFGALFSFAQSLFRGKVRVRKTKKDSEDISN